MSKYKMILTPSRNTQSAEIKIDLKPNGVTLIELMLVTSLISVIFTVGATTLAFLMRVEMNGTLRIQQSLILQNLAHQFREDASAAQNVRITSKDKKNNVLKFEMERDVSITYSNSQQGSYILRVKKDSNNRICQNEYRTPKGILQFGSEKLNQRILVSMHFQMVPEELHENKTVENTYRSFKVESLINRKYSIRDRIMETN